MYLAYPPSIPSSLDASAGVILGLCRQRARLPIHRTLLNESHSFHSPALAPFLEYSRHLVLLSGCQDELTGSTPTHRQCSSRGGRPPGAHMFALPLSRSATLQAMASDQHLPSCVLLGNAPGVLQESEGGYRAPRMPGRALQVLSHPTSFRNHQMS